MPFGFILRPFKKSETGTFQEEDLRIFQADFASLISMALGFIGILATLVITDPSISFLLSKLVKLSFSKSEIFLGLFFIIPIAGLIYGLFSLFNRRPVFGICGILFNAYPIYSFFLKNTSFSVYM